MRLQKQEEVSMRNEDAAPTRTGQTWMQLEECTDEVRDGALIGSGG